MIDVHAHFADENYDFPAEWEKIKAAGVKSVILASDTLAHAAWHREFCEKHEGAYFTVGIHPEFAGSGAFYGAPPTLPSPLRKGGGEKKSPPALMESAPNSCPASGEGTVSCPPPASGGGVGEGVRPQYFAPLEELAAHKKCVAVGEIGLDYHYDGHDKTAQRALFEAQLEMAERLGLPAQIHSRDACADTLAILREHRDCIKRGFLMHCYSYGAENLPEFLELGAYFSFGGVVCFHNARRAVEAVAACPMDRILSETDSPYLSPFRGEKNSPANIPLIVKKLAEIKGVPFSEMVGSIHRNASALFGLALWLPF